jgi:hypothetical protein
VRTLNIRTSIGTITSLDVSLDFDFFGNLSQVFVDSPFDTYLDSEYAGVGAHRTHDTHFLFDPVPDTLTVNDASESATHLIGDFTGFTPFTNRDVAQIVLPIGSHPTYTATATVDLGGGQFATYSATDELIPGFVPEPSTLTLVVLGLLAIRTAKQTRPTADFSPPWSLDI